MHSAGLRMSNPRVNSLRSDTALIIPLFEGETKPDHKLLNLRPPPGSGLPLLFSCLASPQDLTKFTS